MATAPSSAPRQRDPRLDFFRGTAMFIILVAHVPGNWWTLWIPARFGFSDATEIFVFCSGMASALAFGAVFDRHGWLIGTARILFRVWQVYWAHIATFLVIAMGMVWLNGFEGLERDYVGRLNLHPFFEDTSTHLLGLMTLTYVPNYFDILPMYLVILAMIPPIMALSRIGPWAACGAVVLIWVAASLERWAAGGWSALAPLAATTGVFHLPAQYWFEPPNNTRNWFFNPFAWQLVFFTGFAFMRGWLPRPPVRWWLIGLALAIVLASVPIAYFRIIREIPWIGAWREEHRYLFTKIDFGILRYVHFLALAYLAWVAAGPDGARLRGGRLWTGIVGVVRTVGQQSLAVFVVSLVLARFLGVAFDIWDKSLWLMAVVNLGGVAVLIAVAYGVGWFKSSPWKPQSRPAAPIAQPA